MPPPMLDGNGSFSPSVVVPPPCSLTLCGQQDRLNKQSHDFHAHRCHGIVGFSKVVFEKTDLREAYYPPIAPPIILSVNYFATHTTLQIQSCCESFYSIVVQPGTQNYIGHILDG